MADPPQKVLRQHGSASCDSAAEFKFGPEKWSASEEPFDSRLLAEGS
jgi:hypothetical protein